MTDAMWGVVGAIIAGILTLLGGSFLLRREQRKKLDSETQTQMATAKQIEAATDLTLAGGWRELAESWEVRFNALEQKYTDAITRVDELRLKLFQSTEDVRLAIRDKHDCERQLDDMRARVEILEQNQKERIKSRSR